MRNATVVALAVVLGACESVPEPYELDHTRVMAIRAEPPAITSGERARIDVLVTDDTTGPRVADADDVTIASTAEAPVSREEDGWYVACLDSNPRVATVSVAIVSGDEALIATKTIAFGSHADNPAAPAILHDGQTGTLAIEARADVMLATDPAPAVDDDTLSYRWFSSVGEIVGYTRPEAKLKPSRNSSGQIWLVVRDQAGGVAWTAEPASVAP